MQPLIRLLIGIAVLSMIAPVFAQDGTSTPTPIPQTTSTETELLNELEAAVERVENAEARAVSFFGLFEGIGVYITVATVIVTLIVAAGNIIAVIFFRQRVKELNRLEEDLRTATEQLNDVRSEFHRAHFALSLLPLAERQYRSGNLAGALNTYQRASEYDSQNAVPFYHMGYLYTQQNNLQLAESCLNTAMELDSEFHHARAALGYVYRRMGELKTDPRERDALYEKAAQYLQQALSHSERLMDDDGESWFGSLAGLYRRWGRINDAMYYYGRAAEITPNSSYPMLNLALLNLQEGAGNYVQAFERVIKLARREVQADVDNYWGYGDLLLAQIVLGKYADADDTLETLLETIPPTTYDVLPRIKEALEKISSYLGDDPERAAYCQKTIQTLDNEMTNKQSVGV